MSLYPAAGEFYIYTVVLVSKLGAMGCAAGMGKERVGEAARPLLSRHVPWK